MLKNIYIQNEARKGFKGWTKEGVKRSAKLGS